MESQFYEVGRKSCFRSYDSKIRHDGQTETAADGGALNCGDHWLFAFEQPHSGRIQWVALVRIQPLPRLIPIGITLAAGEICPGTKMLALGCENQCTYVIVFVHGFERVTHRVD